MEANAVSVFFGALMVFCLGAAFALVPPFKPQSPTEGCYLKHLHYHGIAQLESNSASGPRRGTVKEIDTSAPPGSGGWSHLAVMVFDDEPDKELYVNAFECELDYS